MSQKLFKILLLSVLTIGLVILGVMLVRAKNRKDAAQIQFVQLENPFGLEDSGDGLPGSGSGQSGTTVAGEGEEQPSGPPTPIDVTFVTTEDFPVFANISNEPVAGATFVYEEREIPIPEEASVNLVEGYDFTGYPTLRFGDDREEVSHLKTVLNRQTPSPSLAVDTAFDTALKTAVIDFQTKNNLNPDAIVGSGTYKKLNDFQGIEPKVTSTPQKEIVEVVRYVERSNGYVYDIDRGAAEKRIISNRSIQRVYEAYFNDVGNKIIMRYLRSGKIENIVASLKPSVNQLVNSNLQDTEISPLPDKISFVSLLPNRKKVIYMTKDAKGELFSYDFANGQIKKIWQSNFSDWIPDSVSENIISLTPRSSGLYPNTSYILTINNNNFDRIFSEKNGLTTNISPDGKKVIVGYYEGGRLVTQILNVSDGSIRDFAPSTLPEKCVWSLDSKTVYCGGPLSLPSGIYPDDWYKGETLFRDILWKIDAENNISTIILDANRIPQNTDMTRLMLNPKEDYLIFINKHDNNLYGIDLGRI